MRLIGYVVLATVLLFILRAVMQAVGPVRRPPPPEPPPPPRVPRPEDPGDVIDVEAVDVTDERRRR